MAYSMAVMFQTQTVTSTISFDAMNCLISNEMETDFLYTINFVLCTVGSPRLRF